MTRSSFRFDSHRAVMAAGSAGVVAATLALISGLLGNPPVEQAAIAVSLACGALSLAIFAKSDTMSATKGGLELAVIKRIVAVCGEITKGNFEARIIHIGETGILGDVQHSVNNMIDCCDAFVREATGSLQAVCQNIYYRRIMLGGMQGSFRVAAEAINNAVKLPEQAVEKARHDAALQHAKVMGTIGEGLDNLKTGNLTFRLADLPEAFVALKTNYDLALNHLEAALANVGRAATSVNAQSHEISAASDELSERIERQAAMLEQSSAAIEELVGAVNRAADASTKTKDIISAAKVNASESIDVVHQSVKAIERIKDASERIGAIIGAIDDIAFQTNLLALNAGIEAARAGIKEINVAIGELDATTQQNAAMGEQATASCRSLADESAQLTSMLSNFSFRDGQMQEQAPSHAGRHGASDPTTTADASSRQAA